MEGKGQILKFYLCAYHYFYFIFKACVPSGSPIAFLHPYISFHLL